MNIANEHDIDMRFVKLPTKNDWGDYEFDYDLIDLYRLFFGKKIEDVYSYFNNYAYISRSDELLHANRKIFQYYIYAFALYLQSNIGRHDDEAKEVFLRLLIDKEKRDPNSVCDILTMDMEFNYIENDNINKVNFSLYTIINNIESDYEDGVMDSEIYENIPMLLDEIKQQCNLLI